MYSGIDIKGLNKICPEINYLKDEELKKLQRKYKIFSSLLEQRRKVKNIKGGMTYKEIEEITQISKRTYYRLKKQLKTKDWKGIERKNKRPKNVRQSKIPEETKELILKIRLDNPTYGKEKIKRILKRDNNIDTISSSSIGRILRKLDERGLIRLRGSKLKKKLKPNEINNTKGRDFSKSHSQRWDYKKHNVFNTRHNNISKMKPRELIQIDRLKLNKNNLRFVEFSAIDPITRYKVSHCYSSPNSKNAKDFLVNKLLKQLPFKVISIQVDGGSEFRKHFEDICEELNIPLYVLPPYGPKYNGRIERSNRTVREEFYNNNNLINYCNTIGEFNVELEKYMFKYNSYRPHERLDYLTPIEYYLRLIERGNFAPNVSGL